jgi:hypothetical protein
LSFVIQPFDVPVIVSRSPGFGIDQTPSGKVWITVQIHPSLFAMLKKVKVTNVHTGHTTITMVDTDTHEKALIGSDPDNPLPAPAPLLDASLLSTGTLKEVLEAHEAAKANATKPS